ncbi:MAG: hypothetical protein AVDCRST_MAG86-372 [uncultured Truepera sp.]|uniref:DUF11 domain-containing protein n=1 Tax=uncultured Truepera sp. TaxID=543023 RepID=A0A6J4UN53_9DEIN|nr:MAG: hypothetical protein AVDCRST_MAG86-372 [uncultured Truepera sp.]
MKQVGWVVLLTISLALVWGFAQAQPVSLLQSRPIRSRIETFVVTTDARGNEHLARATSARVAERVRYLVSFTNVTDDKLPASETTLSGPIPAGAAYVEGSATRDNFLVRLARVGENSVQWDVNHDLPPRATVQVQYDVMIRRSALPASPGAAAVPTAEGRILVVYSADVFPLSCDFSVALSNAYGRTRRFARKSYGWRYSFVASPEDRLSLRVRSLCSSGSVTATIRVNDEVFKSATSKPGSGSASVSGSYGER